MKKEYSIIPVAKPRQSRRDQWLSPPRPSVWKYRHFCDLCRYQKIFVPASDATVTFILPMPEGWSKKKKKLFDGQKHIQTPDLDNLLKALGDALYDNDSCIWDVRITKIWGYEGKIVIKENRTKGKQ